MLTAILLQACGATYSASEIESWVVDAETQAPLEGVHVVAHWVLKFGMEGGSRTDLELMETVSDINGRFYFPAWGPTRTPMGAPWYARLQNADPEIIFFKSGYEPKAVFNDRHGPPYGLFDPKHRMSLWHGKKIPLKKFAGEPQLYRSLVSGTITGVSWGDCGWAKIPRMMLALNAEAEKLSALNIPHGIPTLRDVEATARGKVCTPIERILERYRP